MEKLKLANCHIKIKLELDDGSAVDISRFNKDVIITKTKKSLRFTLPLQQIDYQKEIFGISEESFYRSLLGAFYIDQDRGWGLLNRGTVIGNNQFIIDVFLSSFADAEIRDYQERKYALEAECRKYKELINLLERQKSLENYAKDDVDTSVIESIQTEIDILKVKLNELNKESSRLKQVKQYNDDFRKYVDHLKILVKKNNEEFTLTSDMIVSNGNKELIETRLSIVYMDIDKTKKQLDNLSSQLNTYLNKKKTDLVIESYSVTPLSKLDIDVVKLQSSIGVMSEAIRNLESKIKTVIDSADYANKLNQLIMRNATFLNVERYISRSSNISMKKSIRTYSGTDFKTSTPQNREYTES